MALFSAKELAGLLCSKWSGNVLLKDHPAPVPEGLEQILEAAYCAGMKTEEGRSLRFRLILLRPDEVEEKEQFVARFESPRPLSIDEIQRLAPATEPSTFIAVEQTDKGPRIWGTVDFGSAWFQFRRGERSSGEGLPFHLVVTVTGPGAVSVAFSDFLLFSTHAGQAALPAVSSSNVLKFGPVGDLFRPVLGKLLKDSLPDGGASDSSELDHTDAVLVSYAGEYLRFFSRTLRFAEELGHGGTIIVIRGEQAATLHTHAAVKYKTVGLEFWSEMRTYLRLIWEEIELGKVAFGPLSVEKQDVDAWRKAHNELAQSTRLLLDGSRFLARLTQVDGAVFLTDELTVLGFGGVIKDLSELPTVRECSDERCLTFKERGTAAYGTRHRSVFSLCKSMDSVAFVLSQDGGVKAVKCVGDEVLLWPSVELGPSAWFLTAEDLIPELRERYLNRSS